MNLISIVASKHPVASVMVFKSSQAEVTRYFDVDLKRGRNKVTISKLPTTIEKESIRVSMIEKESSNTSLEKSRVNYLSDIVCSPADNPGYDPTRYTLRALELKRSGLESEKRLLDAQAEVMVSYARSLTGEHASLNDIDNFLSTFGERGRKNINEVLKIEEQIATIDEQINEALRRKKLMKGTLNTEVAAVAVADGDMTVQFQLIYIVSNAVWSPNYKLHAVTGEDGKPSRRVALHYHASVKQATGEDWADASLMLSTVATDTLVKKIPRLEPVKAITVSPVLYPGIPSQPTIILAHGRSRSSSPSRRSRRSRSPSTTGGRSPSRNDLTRFRVEPDFTNSQKHTAEDDIIALSDDEPWDTVSKNRGRKILPIPKVTQTPMTLTYTVRGNSDIPSDGKEHVVTIVTLDFEADVEYISVPRLDPRVFLQCQVKNTSEYRLLPGPVNVIMDKSYVSHTRLPDVNRNETFDFTLGDDPSIIVLYERSSKVTKEGTKAFADPLDITTYTTTVTAHNTHRFAIENIIVRDAVPTSADNQRIKVVLQKPQALIEAKEGVFVEAKESRGDDEAKDLMVKWEKEQDGLYEYKWRINAEDKVKFETVFDVKAPSDTKYSLSNFAIQGKTA
ncbi:hypothetical protein Agabi119p4_5313 [Agaricus bisporus var. burnettii]|uniref:DUF4139 domain-containing protein n=1 Tax=Agaricus bisporus var. burnettii TaxID=192524 RepID=A0A8H7F1F5_AGABI|nr:hypothetical protein Agabi119p4_5313 [Agaricus bisporus var. burnettii]